MNSTPNYGPSAAPPRALRRSAPRPRASRPLTLPPCARLIRPRPRPPRSSSPPRGPAPLARSRPTLTSISTPPPRAARSRRRSPSQRARLRRRRTGARRSFTSRARRRSSARARRGAGSCAGRPWRPARASSTPRGAGRRRARAGGARARRSPASARRVRRRAAAPRAFWSKLLSHPVQGRSMGLAAALVLLAAIAATRPWPPRPRAQRIALSRQASAPPGAPRPPRAPPASCRSRRSPRPRPPRARGRWWPRRRPSRPDPSRCAELHVPGRDQIRACLRAPPLPPPAPLTPARPPAPRAAGLLRPARPHAPARVHERHSGRRREPLGQGRARAPRGRAHNFPSFRRSTTNKPKTNQPADHSPPATRRKSQAMGTSSSATTPRRPLAPTPCAATSARPPSPEIKFECPVDGSRQIACDWAMAGRTLPGGVLRSRSSATWPRGSRTRSSSAELGGGSSSRRAHGRASARGRGPPARRRRAPPRPRARPNLPPAAAPRGQLAALPRGSCDRSSVKK
jgi:hypothetical protein